MLILDTNTIVYLFRRQGQVVKNFRAANPDSIYIPTVVLYELEVGLAKANYPRRRVQELNKILEIASVAVFDEAAASASALIRAKLEQQGTPIGPIDMLIAGIAVSLNATVVTHNAKEFSRVEGLEIVDWF